MKKGGLYLGGGSGTGLEVWNSARQGAQHTVTDGYCGESTIGCCVTDGMILLCGGDRTLLKPYDHFCAKSQ